MRTLIIIPAYNEAENIKKVINSVQKEVPDADYLVVNDCSRDSTEQICKTNQFNYVSLPINLGIGGGVQTGYLYARNHHYDIAVQIDGDGQHNPKYIRNVIEPIVNQEADIVIGSRFLTGDGFQSSTVRRFGIRFLSDLIHICDGIRIKDVTSGYRAVNRKFIEIYAKTYAQDYPEPEAIIAAAQYGAKIQEVPVVMMERTGGVSSISTWKPFYYMLKVSLAILLYRITFKKEGLN
ncbi:Glycosyl transferase family 2 [Ruminococcaceae bacterium BL-6]|jgi:hypothetical protein|nr:Glycosyl transferase family 2 [Ruminococcaceae bacterium BL-6]